MSDFSLDPRKMSAAQRMVSCSLCGDIISPQYYMVCRKNQHLLCGMCAWPRPTASGEPTQPAPPSPPSCCNPVNLLKGDESRMEATLGAVLFNCTYSDKGCSSKLPVMDWMIHVRQCKYRLLLPCHYYQCELILAGREDALKHYTLKHGAMNLPFSQKLEIVFDEAETAPKRKLGFFKENDNYYLFAGEIFKGELHLWLWDFGREDGDGAEYDKKFRIILVPKNPAGDGQLSYEGIFQPITRSCESIISNSDCFSIGIPRLKEKYLRNVLCDATVYTVIVSIVRKERPTLPVGYGDELKSEFERQLDLAHGNSDIW